MSAETLVSQVNVAFGIAPWFFAIVIGCTLVCKCHVNVCQMLSSPSKGSCLISFVKKKTKN